MENDYDNSVSVVINKVSKSYKTKTKNITAIKSVSMNIYNGEFIAIIGPSGCGKTTLLRLVAGLEKDYEGDIIINGRKVVGPGLDRGIIFQDHRLMPWLTVGENVALGLEGNKKFIEDKTIRYLKKVNLEEFKNVYPKQLSGGMAQRAAIARALSCQPEVLLLDEPFGALDALTRMHMQEEVERIWLAEKTTMILITHDIEEAVFLADRIFVMSSRPAEISAVFEVKLGRTRSRSDPEFVNLRKMVMNSLNESQGTYSI